MKKSEFIAELKTKHRIDHKKIPNAIKPMFDFLLANCESISAGDAEALERLMASFVGVRRTGEDGKQLPIKKFPGNRASKKPNWLNHGFRAKDIDGLDVYYGDPHSLANKDIKELAQLVDDGYDVVIQGATSAWFPGHTFRVAVS